MRDLIEVPELEETTLDDLGWSVADLASDSDEPSAPIFNSGSGIVAGVGEYTSETCPTCKGSG